ncbi:hypothetical protein [Rhodococcus opacus]|uniref:hypothetical protein n=1 Tax=Rhodococcus opacus TaxID=37919 RepID=UPI0002E9B1CE|nr:hypothetical protein [Rhodococcus opacus]
MDLDADVVVVGDCDFVADPDGEAVVVVAAAEGVRYDPGSRSASGLGFVRAFSSGCVICASIPGTVLRSAASFVSHVPGTARLITSPQSLESTDDCSDGLAGSAFATAGSEPIVSRAATVAMTARPAGLTLASTGEVRCSHISGTLIGLLLLHID